MRTRRVIIIYRLLRLVALGFDVQVQITGVLLARVGFVLDGYLV